MTRRPRITALALGVAAALAFPERSHAVRLDDGNLGQALIFPYYTVQSSGGDAYNTYVSVVNHSQDTKALRVRVREGRAGREVASFNLYMPPWDVWTGAIVPGPLASDAPRLVTADTSCTSPFFTGSPRTLVLQNSLYSGANDDGNGAGLDRAREGFVEMIEMATLSGATAAAVNNDNAGVAINCAAVQGNAAVEAAAPSGGLSGTLTLINVKNGLNFDLNAVALADLATRPFYRPASDPYPDFNAAEIDPVSVVVANGALYHAAWSQPVDAVSAVLMRSMFEGEYVLDEATASNTDFVVTFPTREYYVTSFSARAPFSAPSIWAPRCTWKQGFDEFVPIIISDRERLSTEVTVNDYGLPNDPPATFCASTVVFDVSNTKTAVPDATRVLGSLTRGYSHETLPLPARFSHGWLRGVFLGALVTGAGLPTFVSLPTSTRIDLASGATTTAPQTFLGLPVIGFMTRTFMNGTLSCAGGSCQGNYGGAYPLQYRRTFSP